MRKRRVPAAAETNAPDEPPRVITLATVLVPYGKLTLLAKLIEDYLDKDTDKGQPKNRELIESISQIRQAALDAFWTEDSLPFPALAGVRWWEAWLRAGDTTEAREAIVADFRRHAQSVGAEVNPKALNLPESTVVMVRASGEQLGASLDLLNCLTELRQPGVAADYFVGEMNPVEQRHAVEEAAARVSWPDERAVAVCLLDTGVNNGHPLLGPALADADRSAYHPDWGVDDHHLHGHGTQMAGLALFGDLTDLLGGAQAVELRHRLESVKMLPPFGANDPHLYGEITKECVARAEAIAPTRPRVVCTTVTSRDGRDRGRPTSWSTAIDQICSGAQEEDSPRRLLVLSAGNAELERGADYPALNATEVHDPGQAWNALTVGACTEKVAVDTDLFPGWLPVAQRGGLGPYSTTSATWVHHWPLKPDIVLEGGNLARHPTEDTLDAHDSLRLLTTHHRPGAGLLTTSGDTSGAAAQAARMAAIIQAQYPDLWPETVRGLLVHSSTWSKEMMKGYRRHAPKHLLRALLRTYGFGTPDLAQALHSASNSLTLICQEEFQPFFQDGSEVKTKDLVLHQLPWPREALQELGEERLQMRVTLSYFVEPNPGPRSSNDRYRYASCGLRFEVCRAEESLAEFRYRINRAVWDEGAALPPGTGHGDVEGWFLGSELRHRGSIHSDFWFGTAAALAAKNTLAVFPVNGWWRFRKHLRRYNSKMRYALVVTIKSRRRDIDIYTPVTIPVPVEN